MIDAIFTLINIAILVAFSTYIFKSYIAPFLQREIEDERHEMLELCKARDMLEQEAHALVDRGKQSEEECVSLTAKVDAWQMAVVKAQEQKRVLHQQHKKELTVQYHRQRMFREMQRMQSRGLPQAMAQARLELYEHFQTTDAGQVYMKDVVEETQKKEQA